MAVHPETVPLATAFQMSMYSLRGTETVPLTTALHWILVLFWLRRFDTVSFVRKKRRPIQHVVQWTYLQAGILIFVMPCELVQDQLNSFPYSVRKTHLNVYSNCCRFTHSLATYSRPSLHTVQTRQRYAQNNRNAEWMLPCFVVGRPAFRVGSSAVVEREAQSLR